MNLRRKLQQYIALNSYVEKYTDVLPAGYERLEYIENDSTQWLDTGMQPSTTYLRLKTKLRALGVASGTKFRPLGSQISILPWSDNISEPFKRIAFGESGDYTLNNTALNIDYEIDLTANNGELTGKYCGTSINTTYTGDLDTRNQYLFTANGINSSIGIALVRFYYVQYYNAENSLAFNGIPARRISDGTVGMYDTISGTFLTNSGTGDFVAGPSITDFKDAIHDGLKEITAYGKAIQPAKNYLDSVIANGGTELVSDTFLDTVTAKGKCVQENRLTNGLPNEYQELYYIESDGSAYINTGYIPNNETKAECVVDRPIAPANGYVWYPFTTENDSTNGQFAVFESTNGAGEKYAALTWGKVATSEVVTGATTSYSKSLFILQNGVLTYDNNKTITSPQAGQTFSCTNPITLFKRLGTTSNFVSVRMYSFKLYQGTALIMNLLPVRRKADDEVGMYDTISKTFLTNQDTGIFTASEDKLIDSTSSDYTILDYATFDSTQIVDTGFIPDNNSRIESKCYRTGADCWFYGAGPTNPRVTLYQSSTGTSRWGNQSVSSVGFVANTEYTLIEDKNGLSINGVNNSWAGTAGDFTCDRSLTIGNCNGSTSTRYFAGNLYYMRIYDNGVLVRSYIPVKRNSDNVVGFFDTVSGTFITPFEGNALVAGTVKTTWEPTPNFPVDIWCNNGVLRASINEFDVNTITNGYFYNADLEWVENSSVYITDYMKTVKGKYTLVLNRVASLSATVNIRINLFNANKEIQSQTVIPITPDTTEFTYEVDIPNGISYVRISTNPSMVVVSSFSNSKTIYTDGAVETIKDVIGNTATAEILLKVGDYQDTQSILDGVVTRNVGVKVLDGTENWTAGSGQWAGNCYCDDLLPNLKQPVAYQSPAICTAFPMVESLTDFSVGEGYISSNPVGRVNLWYNDTVANFKQYLADQYAAGTPVIIVYPLNNATTTTVNTQMLRKEPVYVVQSGLSDLEVETVSSVHSVPTPDYPLDIRCNNGVLQKSPNLFNKNNYEEMDGYVDGNTGVLTVASGSSNIQRCVVINVKPNTRYQISGILNSNYGAFQTKTIGSVATTYATGNTILTTGPNDKYIIGLVRTTNGAYDYLDTLDIYEINNNARYIVAGIQETLQDSADTINIATCEALFSIGTYKDTQEILIGTITRNVGIKVLDGTENWQNISGYMNISKTDLGTDSTVLPNNSADIICSHFETKTNLFADGIGVGNSYVNFNYDSLFTTLAEWQQYLANQYAKGTPVIIVYPLATSTTESVPAQTLVISPVSIKQASMSGLTVDTTQTSITVPTPARPLDIYCNNGKLGFASIGGEYTQLEYLESSGTQYILTDVVPEKTDKISLELEFTSITSSGKTILGARDIAAAGAGINYAANSSSMTLDFFGSRYLLNEAPELNKKYKYEVVSKVGYIYKEGVLIGSNTFPADGEVSLPLVVFGLNNGGTMAPSEHSYKIHSVVVKGKLNLIPAKRNSDNVVGMYDTVSGNFLMNSGTGDFVAGPVVPGSQGNPETITVHSKNLFNKNGDLKTGTYRVDTGAWVDNDQFRTLDYIPGKPGVSYTLSAESTSETGGNAFSVQAWDSTHTNWLGTIASSTAQSTQYASGISPAGTAYLSVSFAPAYRDINTLQLEEDYRPTVYEEYSSQALSVKDLLGFGNYQTLNYIELANGAYFDTGYKPQNGCEVEFEFDTRTVQASGCSYLGTRSNDVGSGINTGRDSNKKIVADYFGTSSSQRFTSTSVFEDNTSYKVIYRNNTFSLYKNGTLFVSNTFTPTTQTQTNTLLINALHYGNNQITGNVETLRIKSLKVWDASGNLVIDIVPVKETTSGKIGFYDRAINTFSDTFLGGGTVTAGTIDGIVFGNSVISDSQEIINGIINKKVGIIMLTGEETVGAGQAANKFYIDFTDKIPNYPRSQDWLPICTHFAGQVGSLTGSGECTPDHVCFYTASGSTIQLYMSISGDTKSSSQFKAWLAAQYAAGTPVIVLYPIATAVTENVDPQFVELTAGNSYITEESEYVESNLSVKYKKLK